MKSVLVTGASGFVGSALVRKLAEQNYNVHAFSRSSNPWRLSECIDKIKIWNIDLCNRDQLSSALEVIQPNYIYHFASMGTYPRHKNDNEIVETNIMGSWNLLQTTTKYQYELFVNIGSTSEYGFKKEPMKETDILEPHTSYSASKGAQTLLSQYMARAENKPIVTLRLFSIYGPYEDPTRLIPIVIQKALYNQPIDLSAPNISRDFVFIDDVLDICMKHKELSSHSGEIFNICSGEQSSIKKIVDTILALTKSKSKCNYNVLPPRLFDSELWVGDPTKIKEKMDWSTTTTLTDGLSQTILWTKNEHRTVNQ